MVIFLEPRNIFVCTQKNCETATTQWIKKLLSCKILYFSVIWPNGWENQQKNSMMGLLWQQYNF